MYYMRSMHHNVCVAIGVIVISHHGIVVAVAVVVGSIRRYY